MFVIGKKSSWGESSRNFNLKETEQNRQVGLFGHNGVEA